ncbi:hypothetical protein CHS0354_039435 [Potamilus streckersoni]|uniref:non-specific serine/threonine protein kinase n=1 Tax=Potamilus streckersoni TaxID=2493646 RepID=A0AAE0S1G6_9BIVA|nr:hypothetical protein CHS0354_039435 [Potamilus streckersoni]
MNDKLVGGKEKTPDSENDDQRNHTNEGIGNDGSNLNENASKVMGESSDGNSGSESKPEKQKAVEKKQESKTVLKTNGIKAKEVKGRKEDEKKNVPSKQVRKPDPKAPSSSSFINRKDVESRRPDASKSFSDDSKLSNLIRKFMREADRERRLPVLRQLKEYVQTGEGAKAAVKTADDILTTLQEVFFERVGKELKQEVALCIGLVGSAMGQEAQRFFQWLFSQTNSLMDDEVKALYLLALQETLKIDEKKQLTADLMPMVMSNTRTLLENADTPELLVAVIRVILQLANVYPHVFSSHFRDTVDILVGWHIDSTQKDSLVQLTSDSLVSFNPFWVSDISFTLTLLGQFLEDMEAYAEDISVVTGSEHFNEEHSEPEEVVKISALQRVFNTVIRSLGEDFAPGKGRPISLEYIIQIFERIIHSIHSAVKCYYSEQILLATNDCLCLLMTALQANVVSASDTLLPFLIVQVYTDQPVSYKLILSLLGVLRKAVEVLNTQIPVAFLSQLLGPGTLLSSSRFAQHIEVRTQLMSLYHTIMGLKSVPLLEEAYRYLVGDLQQAYKVLIEESGQAIDFIIIDPNPFEDVQYSAHDAEAVCIFSLCVLAEIGNTKNNIIGMWALSPSLFDLLTQQLNLTEIGISQHFPKVHYSILYSLYSHCNRHGSFLSSSSLLTQNTALEGSVLANVNPTTSGNFSRIVTVLSQVLMQDTTPFDSRCLCLKWVSEIVQYLQTNQNVFTTKEFMTLIKSLHQTGYDQDPTVTLCVNQSLQNIYKNPISFPPHLYKGCMKLCMFKLPENNKTVREAYFTLLKLIPINILVTSQSTSPYLFDEEQENCAFETAKGSKATWLARKSHMSRVPLGTFHSHNFRQVVAFILQSVLPRRHGSQNWLEGMFFSSQRSSDKQDWRQNDYPQLEEHLCSNSTLQWFWATWEAAQFCVLSKLRTPLGKPQETFTSIEAVIKSFASEIKSDLMEEEMTQKGDKGDEFTTHLRVRVLLQFMENLEKLLYNAYEGCAVVTPAAPKMVRTFFRTNKGTCLEWLSRIRLNLIAVALHNGLPSLAVRQAAEMLRDMKESNKTQGPEFDQVALYMVQGLCALQEPESIQGVYTWCKDVIGRKMTWIKTAAEKASGRYEFAAKEYQAAVRVMLQLDEGVGSKDGKPDSPRDSVDGISKLSLDLSGSKKIMGILSKQGQDQCSTATNSLPQQVISKFNYIINEVTDCYLSLNDWEAVMDWQETLADYRTRTEVNLPPAAFSFNVDMCYIKALAAFDIDDFIEAQEQLELVPGGSLSDLGRPCYDQSLWKPSDKVQYAQKQFLRVATFLQTHETTDKMLDIIKCLKEAEKLSESVLRVESMDWPILISPDKRMALTLLAVLRKQLEDKRGKTHLLPLCEPRSLLNDEGGSQQEVSTYMQALQHVRLQQIISGEDKKTELENQILQLQLATASLGRKQHNFDLAEHYLLTQASTLLSLHTENGMYTMPDSLHVALTNLRAINDSINQLEVIRIEREGAKLLHSMGQSREAVDILCSSVLGYINSDVQSTIHDQNMITTCSELCARSLLTLVKWFQLDHKMLSSLASHLTANSGQGDFNNVSFSANAAHSIQLLLELEENGVKKSQGLVVEGILDMKIGDSPILSDSDGVIGRLLHLSTMEAQTLPKSWFCLANWCYKWGRKAVDNASHGCVELYPEEKLAILSLLPKGTSGEETETVLSILSQIHSGISSEEDISDQDQSQYDDGAETTRRQLLSSCLPLQIASDDCVERLLNVWRGVVQRVYYYYQLSAKSYFTFLQLNGGIQAEISSNEDCNVIATLRLLRLLVKHAWELRNVLEHGLAVTPTAPWKGIIPQLFSRLSHPEFYVRQSISDLLCRVAEDAPHLIVYPAVVGMSTTKIDSKDQEQSGMLNNYLVDSSTYVDGEEGDDPPSQEEEEEGNIMDESSQRMLQNCLTVIVETLANNNPRMISDVKQLIQELRRITLLWDELWLGTLNQQHQDVMRRISQLENEIKKVNNNISLSKEEKTTIIREKHKTIFKTTVYTMEKLAEITSQPPETPHEKWFQDTYGELIKNALEKLKKPFNPGHPHASWHPFKQIHVSLQQRAQKRNSLILRMDSISPKLEALRNTVIAMPGLGTSGQVVTVESVSNTVQILPTKTKPKKLVFKGSDGKRYPYLFKGLEDLHLDERIMQFLSIVNNMFANANKSCHQLYRARHYSVTPLGPRSGLIQWVDGATALFSLYKRWQQREATAQMLKMQGTNATTTTQPTIPRPSEIYYNKLTPLLREKGIKDLDNRKDWPLSVLRKVLEELIAETPSDLLAKELWCSSTGPNEWWCMTQTYNRSTAVMSMIGYIIGLGDRHLDNVLVDLATGEVIHIDYNVCFEKGKGLRVPEKVPFRLTHNIETALGVTGVEGTFRIASEQVIKTMRKGRETLLTLLEAFVYDPLVDWTTGNEGGYTGAFYGGGLSTMNNSVDLRQNKRDLEREITLSMFSIRVAEMRVAWQQNRDEIMEVLPKLQSQLQVWTQKVSEYFNRLNSQESLQELKALLSEAGAAHPHHQLYTLNERYKEYAIVKETQDAVHKLVEEKINEHSHWQKMHQHVIQSLQTSAFQRMCTDIANSPNLGTPSFSAAKEFLQGAGQGQIISQCEQVEEEMATSLQLQRSSLRRAIDVIHTYATIVSQFGISFAEQNRTSHYLRWLQEMVCDFTADSCAKIIHEFHELYGEPHFSQAKVQLVVSTETRLKAILSDVNGKLIKLLERRSQEAAEASLLEIQVRDGKIAIDSFVQDNGDYGVSSLVGVISTALCALNKRYLQMEGAAAGAGDRLMDLTSRDGDWFLDELCSMSGNVMQFLDMLKSSTRIWQDETFQNLHKAIFATHHVYIALQELNINYRTIILPEALKAIQSQDVSVCAALTQLETILADVGIPLDTMLTQLEMQHRNAIMGMVGENSEIMSLVRKMQAAFAELVEGQSQDSSDMTPGQMLLMGFNGLFARLESEFTELMDSMDFIQVPDAWRKVDLVREAKSMQLSSFTSTTRNLLTSLFFVKRLQLMQDFFRMCTQFAAAIQGLDGGNCFDDEQLSRPVKKFIAEYVRKQVIGFPSQILGYILCVSIKKLGLNVTAEIDLKDVGAENKVPIEDLCKKAVNSCLAIGKFQHIHLTQASSLTSSQDAVWRRLDLTRRLDSNIELLKASLHRTQLQLTRLQWVHEDVFLQASGHSHSQMLMPNRTTVMSEIKKCMQTLNGQESGLSTCQAHYLQLESSIIQRLRWAAGANPSLNLVLQSFEEASTIRKQVAEEDSKHVQDIINLCQGILHLEALRTRTPEALNSDTSFLALINQCNESCMLTASADCCVSDQEIELVNIMPLEEGQTSDLAWIKSASKEVNSQIKDTDKKVISLKEEMDSAKEEINSEVQIIKTLLTTHHKSMSDIRAILKSLAKQEEQERGEQINPNGIREYLNLYKNFSENIATALKMVVSDDITKDGILEANSILDALKEQIPQIYDTMLEMAPPLQMEEKLDDPGQLNFATAPNIRKSEKISRDPKTGKAIQERNSYAVGVWRRVKMKLDGRDPDPNKRLSAAEQVDYVIKEATHLDNLAVLYEGWTPWV